MCKEGIFEFRADHLFCLADCLANRCIVCHVTLQLIAKGIGKLSVFNLRTTTWVCCAVTKFHLCPSHELRFADGAETIELIHGRSESLTSLITKLRT